ncbi:MAG TPA: hypothetical protein VKR54_02290 [Candidatus Babeliales bacterium]|jgi:hypothetical protein|nr:hypothetical protein [Candidatus Babeliales bacterium]
MTAHKARYIITFFISAALCVTTTHTMMKKFKKQPKNKLFYPIGEVWLLQKNKHRPIAITEDEAHFSSSISVENALKNRDRRFPGRFPIGTNISNKDIQFFQTIIHQPAHYGNRETFPDKKYFKALTIAQQLNAPLLYAELLTARLPLEIIREITQKYLRLHNMPAMLCNAIHHQKIMIILAKKPHILCDISSHSGPQRLVRQRQKIKENYLEWSNDLDMNIDNIIRSATLTQSVLLSMIINNRKTNRIVMKIGMHTPGYNAFMAMTEDQRDLICEYLPVTLEQKATRTGWAIESFNITV